MYLFFVLSLKKEIVQGLLTAGQTKQAIVGLLIDTDKSNNSLIGSQKQHLALLSVLECSNELISNITLDI